MPTLSQHHIPWKQVEKLLKRIKADRKKAKDKTYSITLEEVPFSYELWGRYNDRGFPKWMRENNKTIIPDSSIEIRVYNVTWTFDETP